MRTALVEDLGSLNPESDLTTSWTVPIGTNAEATVVAKASGIISGLDTAAAVFRVLDSELIVSAVVEDADEVAAGDVVLRIRGRAHPILVGERTALNFLQHLSGVATLTRSYVLAVASSHARITDTRKTVPGMRRLEKQAVSHGGGVNHRIGLYDAVLVKENHAALSGGVGAAVRRARLRALEETRSNLKIYAEARDLDEVGELLTDQPDRIMLDNMDVTSTREAVQWIRAVDEAIEIEVTGGITLVNASEVASTGVDLISIGALTHSAPALDLSLLLVNSQLPDHGTN